MKEMKPLTLAGIELEISNILETDPALLPEGSERLLDQYLDMLATQEADKVDSFGRFVRGETLRMEAMREEARRFYDKARAVENRLNYLKFRYLETMKAHNLKRINGGAYSISIRNNQSVDVYDLEAVAQTDFAEVVKEIKPDKTRIREALKAGASVPGCRLMDSQSLQVR